VWNAQISLSRRLLTDSRQFPSRQELCKHTALQPTEYHTTILVTLPRLAVTCHRSFWHSVSKITYDCRNGCRPNLVGMGKE